MNNLCSDIGWQSLNKNGESLCGDCVSAVNRNEEGSVVVLADGLGSGVKANILSTLTAKIISTMIARGMRIEDCVETLAATLPICSVRKMAYSTFSILNIIDNKEADIIQYDNPGIILLRGAKHLEFPKAQIDINGKKIYRSRIKIYRGDIFIIISDGVVYAGAGNKLNFGWKRENIINYMKTLSHVGFTAKTLTRILIDECSRLYGGTQGDDATVCTVKILQRKSMNLLIGPPSNRDDCDRMMSLFFAKEGKHIICGGTTSKIAADFLRKKVSVDLNFQDSEVPPICAIEGVDLVTEGVITVNKVLAYARDYVKDNGEYKRWGYNKDGASRIARLLFEEATDINFYVGRAINPAHQNPDLPINFSIKMRLVEELAGCLKQMGKRVNTSYF
jgi:hypothetical protein